MINKKQQFVYLNDNLIYVVYVVVLGNHAVLITEILGQGYQVMQLSADQILVRHFES